MSPKYQITQGIALWFTGLPCSGKTTIAYKLANYLESLLLPALVLDGDIIRPIIAEGIGHTAEERYKSLLKYIKLSNVLTTAKLISIFAVINHSQKQRDFARKSHPRGQYAEIWINTPLDICIKRDTKNLYKKAIQGEINNMVGISIEYTPPENPDVIITTKNESPDEAAVKIFKYLREAGRIDSF